MGSANLGQGGAGRPALEPAGRADRRQNGRQPALQAAYWLLNHPQASLSALLEPVYAHTRQAATQAGVVLWVNDLTEVDYTFHAAKTGLGPIGNNRGRGFLPHSTLAIQPEGRQVLGLGSAQVCLRQAAPRPRPKWTRSPEGQVRERAARPMGPAPPGCVWVHVSGAGSDYFPDLAACVDQGKQFLVRVSRNRILNWEETAAQAAQSQAKKLVDYARRLPPAPGSAYRVAVKATPPGSRPPSRAGCCGCGNPTRPSRRGPSSGSCWARCR